MCPRVSWLRHHLFTQNLQATCSWEILFTICIHLRPKSIGKAECQVCRWHSKSVTEKKSPDIMTQNVVWGGELSWDHSLCIPWDRSSLWVRAGINSQFKFDFYKQVTLGEQPEGRECLGLCHPSLAALYWWGSHPPQPQPPTLVFGVHKACLPMRAQLSEGEEEGVVELMT